MSMTGLLPPPARCQCLAFRSSVASTQSLQLRAPLVSSPLSARMPAVQARVAIRFTRRGRKQLPFYRVIAIDHREKRDGRPLEELGWYDPLRKETNLNAPAIKKWLSVGAQPSETVEKLLKKAMIMDP